MPDPMQQSRFADLSLFHSAVDEVLAKRDALQRPSLNNVNVQAAAQVTNMAEAQGHIHANQAALRSPLAVARPAAVAASPQAAISDSNVLSYCASLARNLALAKFQGNRDLVAQYQAELSQKESACDPHWLDVGIKYAEFLASRGSIPYRRWANLGDFVITGKLPSNARVAIVGDWGTGLPPAIMVLKQIANKRPDIVIHLGDIYYSGTAFEVETYFYNIWCECLNLPASNIATFSLAGNHDMFCGGGPYYNLIDNLGQPASYFCLRNDNWQFVAMDTGLHDSKPDGCTPTFLEDTEVQWLKDKIQNAGARRTVLLSHHQLFSAFEGICGQAVNQQLNSQLQSIFPQVTVWLWGHEHNQVIYKKYLNVLGRCIGHGAFPVGVDEQPRDPKYPEIPTESVRLDGSPFVDHGYGLMELNGPNAKISYFVDSNENQPVFVESF